MQKIFLVIFLLLTLLTCVNSWAVIPKAVLLNSVNSSSVNIHYFNIYFSTKKISLKPNSSVDINFDNNSYIPTLLRITTKLNDVPPPFSINGRQPVIVAMPGDSIWMICNTQHTIFEFKGRHQEELNFCKKLWLRKSLGITDALFEMDVPATRIPISQFLQNWSSLKKEGEALISELENTSGIRPEVAAFLTRNIRLRLFTLLTLPGEYQSIHDSLRVFTKAYNDSVNSELHVLSDYKNLPATANDEMMRALSTYVSYKCVQEGTYPTFKQKYNIAKREFTGFQRAWVCYWILESNGIRSNKNISILLKDYEKWVHPYDEFVRVLKGDPTVPLRSYKGVIFADSLTDSANRPRQLSALLARHKGQVVLLDLWASWCRPCLEELPASVALANKYRSRGVVVLFLSIDKDPNDWQRALKRLPKGIRNVYLFSSPATSSLLKELDVSTIPRYVLLDRHGQIRYPDALRPSDPRLEPILEKLLKL